MDTCDSTSTPKRYDSSVLLPGGLLHETVLSTPCRCDSDSMTVEAPHQNRYFQHHEGTIQASSRRAPTRSSRPFDTTKVRFRHIGQRLALPYNAFQHHKGTIQVLRVEHHVVELVPLSTPQRYDSNACRALRVGQPNGLSTPQRYDSDSWR